MEEGGVARNVVGGAKAGIIKKTRTGFELVKSNGVENFKTRRQAVHRERQINYFKNMKGGRRGGSVSSFFKGLQSKFSNTLSRVFKPANRYPAAKQAPVIKPPPISSLYRAQDRSLPSFQPNPIVTSPESYKNNLTSTAVRTDAGPRHSNKTDVLSKLAYEMGRMENNPNWEGSTISKIGTYKTASGRKITKRKSAAKKLAKFTPY